MFRIARALHPVPLRRSYFTRNGFASARTIQYEEGSDIKDFEASTPAVFKQSFKNVPAIEKWFTKNANDFVSHELNLTKLEQHGYSIVPLELTRSTSPSTSTFERFEAPLSFLLAHMNSADTPDARLYLAQHSLADLPDAMRADLPTPGLLSQLGRGDIYASSLWMGKPPTRTPLHRDPNPNLFVQLAGEKVIRLMPPHEGRALYEKVRMEMGSTNEKANMRGEEMMQGQEMEALEDAVWGDTQTADGVEAELKSGDGLFIPLGWWHAVHGVGKGANASANWWFR